jgi:Ca2+-dependent lipid-binding protein, contains C2 domain
VPITEPPNTSLVPDGANWGEVYVQVKFQKAGTGNSTEDAPLLVDLKAQLLEEAKPVQGNLHIRVVHGKGLPVMDITSSDPFVRIIMPNQETFDTPVSSSNLNPIWRYKKTVPIKLPKNVKR